MSSFLGCGLIEPDQKPLGSIDFQAVHLSMPSHDARFHPKPNHFISVCVGQLTQYRVAHSRLQRLLQRRHILDPEVDLHPSGLARMTKILSDRHNDITQAVDANQIRLGMVQALDTLRVEDCSNSCSCKAMSDVSIWMLENPSAADGPQVRCSSALTLSTVMQPNEADRYNNRPHTRSYLHRNWIPHRRFVISPSWPSTLDMLL